MWGGDEVPHKGIELLDMALTFMRYGVLPYLGGGEDQPFLFWIFVDLISKVQRDRAVQKGKRNLKRINVNLEI